MKTGISGYDTQFSKFTYGEPLQKSNGLFTLFLASLTTEFSAAFLFPFGTHFERPQYYGCPVNCSAGTQKNFDFLPWYLTKNWLASRGLGTCMDVVALVKAKDNLEESLRKGIALIGGFGTIQSPVLVKPNICTKNDNTGFSVTDARLVEALIRLLLQESSDLSIRIVESDSQSKWADAAFDKFGYTTLTETFQKEGFDVSCVNLSKYATKKIAFEGDYFTNPKLPGILTQAGYVISVAVAKTHYLTFITGVLKNLFGLLPRKDQGFYHSKINDVLLDLVRLVSPNLSIVDARVGVEGWNGPKTRRLEALIIGQKPASVDATMLRVMGFNPKNIRHVVEASKYNQGSLNPEIVGEQIEQVKVQFNPPEDLDSDATISS